MGKMLDHRRNIVEFSKAVLKNLDLRGIDVSKYELDHVCYRVETEEEYHTWKEHYLLNGELLVEDMIGGRKISTFKLHEPIEINSHRKVRLVELPMPKANTYYPTGWEHAEFVVGKDVDLLKFANENQELEWDKAGLSKRSNPDIRLKLQDNPPMAIKFHHFPLDQVIEMEKTK